MNHERVADNKFVKKLNQDQGYLGGCYLATEGEASEEEIARMKEAVVEQMCEDIRKLARERKDFFIIKNGERLPGLDNTITTVAVKYMLPTVKDNIPLI